jgi:hypothetical protein
MWRIIGRLLIQFARPQNLEKLFSPFPGVFGFASLLPASDRYSRSNP